MLKSQLNIALTPADLARVESAARQVGQPRAEFARGVLIAASRALVGARLVGTHWDKPAAPPKGPAR